MITPLEARQLPNLSRYLVRADGVVILSVAGRTPHAMANRINDEGYVKLKLTDDLGGRREYFVHVLVARAFLPPPIPGQRYVLHKDRCRTNAQWWNLKWGTHHDNHDDKVKHGSLVPATRKLLPRDVRKIRSSKLGAAKLAKQMGLSISHVREVRNYRKWASHP